MTQEGAELMWYNGRAKDAGALLFGALSASDRPIWAARVLQCAMSLVAPPVAAEVLNVARDSTRWSTAKTLFERVRAETLRVDDHARSEGWSNDLLLLGIVLATAEQVAKVTYNEASPYDPFDDDSGWWIAVLARRLADASGDTGLEQRLWSALSAVVNP